MKRSRKSANSCVKDGFRQLQLDKCFLVSTKFIESNLSVSKTSASRKMKKCSKKLFAEEVIVIEDDEETSVVSAKNISSSESVESEKVIRLELQNEEQRNVMGSVQTQAIVKSEKTVISLNKPVSFVRSPEKPKPRVLQSFKTNSCSSISNLDSITASEVLSPSNQSNPNSTNSDDTIIYNPKDDWAYPILSPASKLIEKVDENVRATRNSSIAYRKSDFYSHDAKRSPKKSPEKNSNSNEILSNPRAVNLVTKIVKYVFSQPHFKILFNEEEIASFDKFFDLPLPEYNYICYKLFTRLPRWYNIIKLCENIHLQMSTVEIQKMHKCLGKSGFVLTDYNSEPAEQLLNLLQSKDIKDILDSFRLKGKTGTKSQLINCLLQSCSKQTTLTLTKNSSQILRDRIREKLGDCVKLSGRLYDLLYRVHLLYSLGNSELAKPHDLYQFISKVENGDIILPEYNIDTRPLFASREDFLSFTKASEYKTELFNAFESKSKDTMIEISRVVYKNLLTILNTRASDPPKPTYLLRFSAGAKYASALTFATKHLAVVSPQEVKEWLTLLLSQQLYCRNKRGFWYDQLAMIETKYLKNYEAGAAVIIEALDNKAKLQEVNLHDISTRGIALKNSKKYKLDSNFAEKIGTSAIVQDYLEFPSVVVDAKAIQGNETGRKRTYIDTQNDGDRYLVNVEQIALNYYLKNGFTKGIHCEGSLLATLLFVLFWDIIYDMEVPSAFINEIQYIPLDFFTEDFYTNRKEHIDKRLSEIKSSWSIYALHCFAIGVWESCSNKRSFIVKELIRDAEELIEIITCIGRECLSSLLDRLIKDFRQYHSGLPDLFVWNFEEKKCRFIEVKGEKDKLSTKQKLWLDYLRRVNADIQVCHVYTLGSKSTQKIKRLRQELKENASNG